MSNEQALLNCTFGWGKTCHLYPDSIEIAGKSYNLDNLTAIYPTYRNVLGVPSARLELFFGPRRLILRGIPDLELARLMVAHLQPYCAAERPIARVHSRSAQARNLVREQARTWERSAKLPAIPVSPEEEDSPNHKRNKRERASRLQETCEASLPSTSHDDSMQTEATPVAKDESRSAEEAPLADNELESEAPFPTPIDPWPITHAQPLHAPRFQPPLRSVHLVAPGQKLQNTCSMPVPVVKSSVLPVIHVPVRLQPGECAHYSIGASLCSDRISGSDRAPYPPLDHGLLILTNRRIFYIGKRSQLILAYTHLWYVSLLHNAIALHIEQQFRRIIIELEHPQEWASRIEQLSFIARRARPRPELPTLLMAALPGLPPSSLNAATLKRPAITVSAHKAQKKTDMPLLSEQIESRIVEEPTISLRGEAEEACSEKKTQEVPFSLAQKENAVQEAPPQPDQQDTTASDARQNEMLSNTSTQDLPLAGNLVEAATQKLTPPPPPQERNTQELAPTSETAGTEPARSEHAKHEEEEEVTTSELTWRGGTCEEIDTLPLHGTTDELEDDEAQTISLRDRRIAGSRMRSQNTPVSDRLPDIEVTPRCLTRKRGMRSPAYAKETKPK